MIHSFNISFCSPVTFLISSFITFISFFIFAINSFLYLLSKEILSSFPFSFPSLLVISQFITPFKYFLVLLFYSPPPSSTINFCFLFEHFFALSPCYPVSSFSFSRKTCPFITFLSCLFSNSKFSVRYPFLLSLFYADFSHLHFLYILFILYLFPRLSFPLPPSLSLSLLSVL